MQDAVVATSHALLLWLVMLLMLTVLLSGCRYYWAAVMAMFGRCAATGQALARLAVAASLPALLCSGRSSVNPDFSAWDWLGTAHLAITWYGLRGMLPHALNVLPNVTAVPADER